MSSILPARDIFLCWNKGTYIYVVFFIWRLIRYSVSHFTFLILQIQIKKRGGGVNLIIVFYKYNSRCCRILHLHISTRLNIVLYIWQWRLKLSQDIIICVQSWKHKSACVESVPGDALRMELLEAIEISMIILQICEYYRLKLVLVWERYILLKLILKKT